MAAPPTRLYDTLRQLFDTALELAQVRLELLISDVQLEKQRLLEVALRALLGLMLLSLGLLLVAGTVLLVLWDNHRLAAMIGLSLASLAGGLALLYAARQRLHREGGLLPGTRGEIGRDRDALRSQD